MLLDQLVDHIIARHDDVIPRPAGGLQFGFQCLIAFEGIHRKFDASVLLEFLDHVIGHVAGPRVDVQFAAMRRMIRAVGHDIRRAGGIRNASGACRAGQ